MIKLSMDANDLLISGIDNAADQMKVKRLPGRYYDHDHDRWVVPIRPGLAAALEQVFNFSTVGALLEEAEARYLWLIAPPAPGSVKMNDIPAAVAVELACLWHFYKYHNGDPVHYARVHFPYIMGE